MEFSWFLVMHSSFTSRCVCFRSLEYSRAENVCKSVERTATEYNPKDGSTTNDEWLYWQNGNDSMVTADSLRDECFMKLTR